MSAIDRASQPDPENPEWTEEMAAVAVSVEALPATLQRKLRGRPRAEVTKKQTTIRLSPDVLAAFRAMGPGWQTRIDSALREWLSGQSAR